MEKDLYCHNEIQAVYMSAISNCDQDCLERVAVIPNRINRSIAPEYLYQDDFTFATSGTVNILPIRYTGQTSSQLYDETITAFTTQFPNAVLPTGSS